MFVVPEDRRAARIGERFGRYVVAGAPFFLPRWKRIEQSAVCRCDCGTIKIVRIRKLQEGTTKSCGCYSREMIALRTGSQKKHGAIGTRLYKTWDGIKQRCGNPRTKGYENYGGRGITVCQEWMEFAAFQAWAISSGYADDKLIDRINNDGNYEPQNCRWADRITQANNRRDNVYITAFGETKTMAMWSRDARCQVTYATMWKRLRDGVPAESAITNAHANVRGAG